MGMCDPKAVRAGKPWYQQVNEPGFITEAMKQAHAERHGILPGLVIGTLVGGQFVGHNKSSLNNTKE
jgi:hypothetical protein